ncbi:hypothetical protein L1887_17637 [Cichorium endivia]|nr:hypothetical protein L1887_17637 [Cichorium endivia]
MERLTMIWFWFHLCTLVIAIKSTSANDTMFPNQTLEQGEGDRLVSKSEIFEPGFFALGDSRFWGLGIRHKQSSIVWVANREYPLVDPTGVLTLGDWGTLELLSATNVSIWSSQFYYSPGDANPVVHESFWILETL